MKQYALIAPNGEIIQTITCPESEILRYDGVAVVCDNTIHPGTHYYKDEFKPYPEKPSGHYSFDITSERWMLSVSQEEHRVFVQTKLRQVRDAKLAESDWTQITDAPLSEAVRQEWRVYRQKLRDLPQNYANINGIDEVEFPARP